MNSLEFYESKSNYHLGLARKNIILELSKGYSKVLDIGCGNGELAKFLKESGAKVSGIDISKKALGEASLYLENSYCFDVSNFEWPEDILRKKFDLIIASEVIEHLLNPSDLLDKIKNLLSPEGIVIITTPNILFWKNRLKILFGKFNYEEEGIMDFGHIRFFTIKSLRKFVLENNMEIILENNFYPNFYFRNLNWVGRLFPGLFAYQMIFLIRPQSSKEQIS